MIKKFKMSTKQKPQNLSEKDFQVKWEDETNYKTIKKYFDPLFGEVVLMKNTKNDQEIMLKEKLSTFKTGAEKDILESRARLELNSIGLMKMLGYSVHSSKNFCSTSYIIKTFYEKFNKTLFNEKEIRKRNDSKFFTNELAELGFQILNGLSRLHSNNRVHGDIRLETIGIDNNFNNFSLLDRLGNTLNFEKIQLKNIHDLKILYMNSQLWQRLKNKNKSIITSPEQNDLFSLGMVILTIGHNNHKNEEFYNIDGTFNTVNLNSKIESFAFEHNTCLPLVNLVRDLLSDSNHLTFAIGKFEQHLQNFNLYKSSKNNIIYQIQSNPPNSNIITTTTNYVVENSSNKQNWFDNNLKTTYMNPVPVPSKNYFDNNINSSLIRQTSIQEKAMRGSRQFDYVQTKPSYQNFYSNQQPTNVITTVAQPQTVYTAMAQPQMVFNAIPQPNNSRITFCYNQPPVLAPTQINNFPVASNYWQNSTKEAFSTIPNSPFKNTLSSNLYRSPSNSSNPSSTIVYSHPIETKQQINESNSPFFSESICKYDPASEVISRPTGYFPEKHKSIVFMNYLDLNKSIGNTLNSSNISTLEQKKNEFNQIPAQTPIVLPKESPYKLQNNTPNKELFQNNFQSNSKVNTHFSNVIETKNWGQDQSNVSNSTFSQVSGGPRKTTRFILTDGGISQV